MTLYMNSAPHFLRRRKEGRNHLSTAYCFCLSHSFKSPERVNSSDCKRNRLLADGSMLLNARVLSSHLGFEIARELAKNKLGSYKRRGRKHKETGV